MCKQQDMRGISSHILVNSDSVVEYISDALCVFACKYNLNISLEKEKNKSVNKKKLVSTSIIFYSKLKMCSF